MKEELVTIVPVVGVGCFYTNQLRGGENENSTIHHALAFIIVTYTRSTVATRVKPLELAWEWRRLRLHVAATIRAIRLHHYRLLLLLLKAVASMRSLNIRHKGAPLQAPRAAVEADAFMSALGGS